MASSRPRLEIENASRSFGSVVALESVSLTVQPGEFLTLLGPSGCGKTTLLRVVAGFERLDRGSVLIQGRDVMSLPPERRPVNLVFQRYALFPHLTVRENVAFGLRVAGASAAETDRRVAEALGTVNLEGYGARHIEELSGGQQQRVAVARAIVNEPELLLLDEPLGALDLQLRKTMQSELRSLQRRLGTTFLYVTHDQEEALVLSDRIAILESGRVAQVGTPEEIYRRPATRFVAGFVGDTNLLPAHLSGGMANGDEAVSVRPEDMSLDGAAEVELEGVVADVIFLGPVRRVIVDVGGTQVKVDCARAAGDGVAPGDRVTASWNRADGTKVA